MTDETDKKEKMKRDLIANSKKSLEDIVYQNVMGANQLKTNPFLYGQLGLSAGEENMIHLIRMKR